MDFYFQEKQKISNIFLCDSDASNNDEWMMNVWWKIDELQKKKGHNGSVGLLIGKCDGPSVHMHDLFGKTKP